VKCLIKNDKANTRNRLFIWINLDGKADAAYSNPAGCKLNKKLTSAGIVQVYREGADMSIILKEVRLKPHRAMGNCGALVIV
jgi:hypothetical protein